jgi:lysophospholipase L1-like esterase
MPIATIENNLSAMIERARAAACASCCPGWRRRRFMGSATASTTTASSRASPRGTSPAVPFLLEGVALNPDLNLDDEFHPNAAGARRIADTVWPYLEALVIASGDSSRDPRP